MNLFRTSWKLGSLAGIGVYMHWTFLLLLGWVLFGHLMAGQGLATALWGVVFISSLFACVVLHELGHALMARRFGVRTEEITLLPIGGIARLERIPENPPQELAIALAGPAVNVVIAGCLVGLLTVSDQIVPLAKLTLVGGSLLSKLMWTNVALAVFNMLPAFPMDGGRVLRALLAFVRPYGVATQMATNVGQVMAVVFGLVGLFGGNLILMLIGLFILIAGRQEANMAQMKDVTRGLPVKEAMTTECRVLRLQNSIEDAAKYLMQGYRFDFPVVVDNEVVGILRRQDVMKAMADHDLDLFVADLMHEHCPTISENEGLDKAIDLMTREGCSTLAVLKEDYVVGILTLENLGEWVALRSLIKKPRRTRRRHGPAEIANRKVPANTTSRQETEVPV